MKCEMKLSEGCLLRKETNEYLQPTVRGVDVSEKRLTVIGFLFSANNIPISLRIKTPPKSIFSILRLNPFLRSASHTVSALPSKGFFSRGAL